MQSGSLYFGEFIFGETGVTVTASLRQGSRVGFSPASQGPKPSFASIAGVQVLNAVTGFAGQDRAGQHAVFPLLPKPREVKGRPSRREM